MASSSQWTWDSTYSLYYDSVTQQWARPGLNGEWVYSSSSSSSRATTTTTRTKRKYFDRDDPDAVDDRRGIPVEQIWPFSDDDAYDEEDGGDTATAGNQWSHDRFHLAPAAPLLRLIVDKSEVLPKAHVALIPPDQAVDLGRDKAFNPRIRLKELQVSKTHATLFCAPVDPDDDEGKLAWQVVDVGSTHGTLVKSEEGMREWDRLSQAKMASEPRKLQHLDLLRVGSTTFVIHIHASLACETCSVKADESNLISLCSDTDSKTSSSSAPAAPTYTSTTKAQKEAERRDRMRGLKEQFRLTPGSSSSSSAAEASTKGKFIDRAAARRERTAAEGGPTIALPLKKAKAKANATAPGPFFVVPGASATSVVAASSTTTSSIDPFGAESRGAKLLAKVGGVSTESKSDFASTNVGRPSSSNRGTGLGQLIDPKALGEGRAGLGSRPMVQVIGSNSAQERDGGPIGKTGNWREDVREMSRKRWKEMEVQL